MINIIKEDSLLKHFANSAFASINASIGIALVMEMRDETLCISIEGQNTNDCGVITVPARNTNLILFMAESTYVMHGAAVLKDETLELLEHLSSLWNNAKYIEIERLIKVFDKDDRFIGSTLTVTKGDINDFRLGVSDTMVGYTSIGLGAEITQQGYPDFTAADTDLYKATQEKENNNDAS